MTETHVIANLKDGREIATPIDRYPSLFGASPEARRQLEVSPFDVHWSALDEDLSVEGMLRGLLP